MKTAVRCWTTLFSSLIVLVVMSAGRPAAQAPALTVTPDNPAIVVGQTQQFTVTGIPTPAMMAGGGYHTCMLMSDRSVRCFGENNLGQLGNGSFNNSPTPLAVNGVTTAVAVGAGIEHSCAILADGTARCWGTNFVGQLGDGTIGGGSAVPKTVQGLSAAVDLAAGGFHNCAILSDRTVRCWGRNQDGQLGNGDNTTDSGVPQPVAGLTGVAALAAGGYHTCALMPDATARCWGRNDRGQLGDGTSTSSSTPVAVNGLTNAAQLSAGLYHTCALLRDGTVQCWGQNDSGQIGNTLVFSSVPVTVSGISNAVAVSAGVFHTCALLSDSTIRCWGQNGNGQLGDGTTTNSSSPVAVSGLTGAVRVTGAGLHSCALTSNQSARCWGFNVYGQLGNGTTTDSPTPVAVAGSGLAWSSSNPSVATIDTGGRATAVARGTTTITATDGSGNTGSTTLTVRELVALNVVRTGDGGGTVTSAPAGIDCGSVCSATFPSDSLVTLTATADGASGFAGWSVEACPGTGPCTITLAAATTVSARFDSVSFALSVNRTGSGSGIVTSSPAGIDCGNACVAFYRKGTVVTLSAAPSAGSVFAGWTGGGCTGPGSCAVTMAAAASVTARFDPSTVMLSVNRLGTGSGTVTSAPAGINCGADCSEPYPTGTSVKLTAAVAGSSTFAGWTGCDAVSGLDCTVAMNAARSVTAAFNLQRFVLAVGKAGAGAGAVTSAPSGISCGTDCSEPYDSGTTVTLTAAPAAGSLFGGWAGCTTVSGTTCTVSMSAARTVTVTFTVQYFTLTVAKTGLGGGTVTSSPAGINCGSSCSALYAGNTLVTLTAHPSLLSGFTGWSGCDSVSGTTCTVRMSAVRSVVASFRLLGIL